MFTKVLIVDDHAAINDGVSSILTSVGVLNIHKALYCDDADLRVKKAKLDYDPFDLVITDLLFKGDHRERILTSGKELVSKLRKDDPNLSIIVYSQEDHFQTVRTLINDCGANGYVCKSRESTKELPKALELVYQGERFLSREVARALQQNRDHEITEYDKELVKQLSYGLSQDEIAVYFKEQNITPNSKSSVEKRLSTLKDQFRAKNPAQLVSIMKDSKFI